jgi:hypothetical protein
MSVVEAEAPDRRRTSTDPFAERDRAPAWTPQPGGKAIGRIAGFATWDAGFGRYPIVVIDQDNGERVAVHAQRKILARELADIQPGAGERIAIRYEGEVERRDGNGTYHGYTVRMPDRSPLLDSLDWTPWATDTAAGKRR